MIIPLFGRGFSSKSASVRSELVTNMYREPSDDKTALALYPTPGLTVEIDVGGVVGYRGAISAVEGGVSHVYAVVGNKLYQIVPGTSFVSVGTLLTSSGRVSLACNGPQIMIVDGTYGYTYTLATTTFAQIVDADFVPGNTVVFLDGYFIVDNPSGRFRWSHLLDGTAWDALDFATAESNPDALQAVGTAGGELYLFGTRTFEVWAPSGDTDVFRRIGGAGANWGISYIWTLCNYKQGLAFLAVSPNGDAVPVLVSNYQVQPMGDPDAANAINFGGASGALTYGIDGHNFYQLNATGMSYLYDDMTDSWTRVSSAGSRHRGEVALADVSAFGSAQYVGDYANGKLYAIDTRSITENGTAITRTVIGKHVSNGLERLRVWNVFLDADPNGSSGTVSLAISRDGGHTFDTARNATLTAGSYNRLMWRRCGMFRDGVFKFSTTAAPIIVNAGMRVG